MTETKKKVYISKSTTKSIRLMIMIVDRIELEKLPICTLNFKHKKSWWWMCIKNGGLLVGVPF